MFGDGPVYSKRRPMIVLWLTNSGMICLPLYSMSEISIKSLMHERQGELASVALTTEVGRKWKGQTPRSGEVLYIEQEPYQRGNPETHMLDTMFVDLVRPIFISRFEDMREDLGRLDRISYLRLVDLFDYRHNEKKKQAYKHYGLNYIGTPPTEPKQQGYERKETSYEIQRRQAMGLKGNEW